MAAWSHESGVLRFKVWKKWIEEQSNKWGRTLSGDNAAQRRESKEAPREWRKGQRVREVCDRESSATSTRGGQPRGERERERERESMTGRCAFYRFFPSLPTVSRFRFTGPRVEMVDGSGRASKIRSLPYSLSLSLSLSAPAAWRLIPHAVFKFMLTTYCGMLSFDMLSIILRTSCLPTGACPALLERMPRKEK